MNMKKLIIVLSGLLLVLFALFALLLLMPVSLDKNYKLGISKNQGYAYISQKLAQDKIIHSRYVLLSMAYLTGSQNKLKVGLYDFKGRLSTWDILQHLNGKPVNLTITVIEGMTFNQFRQRVNASNGLVFEAEKLSNQALLNLLGADKSQAEGLFFPSTYKYDWGDTDLSIYKLAYQTMQKELNRAWEERQSNLPYQSPYELLIMASIIEKETAHENDRNHVAAVFVNRLNIGMRLQTDPTVIYGMGTNYKGRIRKTDLRRDTPYNTYTRDGLPPTPIALPGRAALEAAAHPSEQQYLYFVSRMDNTGLSQFSHNLAEHNSAVRQFILKRKK